jgi:hypothetical protein
MATTDSAGGSTDASVVREDKVLQSQIAYWNSFSYCVLSITVLAGLRDFSDDRQANRSSGFGP